MKFGLLDGLRRAVFGEPEREPRPVDDWSWPALTFADVPAEDFDANGADFFGGYEETYELDGRTDVDLLSEIELGAGVTLQRYYALSSPERFVHPIPLLQLRRNGEVLPMDVRERPHPFLARYEKPATERLSGTLQARAFNAVEMAHAPLLAMALFDDPQGESQPDYLLHTDLRVRRREGQITVLAQRRFTGARLTYYADPVMPYLARTDSWFSPMKVAVFGAYRLSFGPRSSRPRLDVARMGLITHEPTFAIDDTVDEVARLRELDWSRATPFELAEVGDMRVVVQVLPRFRDLPNPCRFVLVRADAVSEVVFRVHKHHTSMGNRGRTVGDATREDVVFFTDHALKQGVRDGVRSAQEDSEVEGRIWKWKIKTSSSAAVYNTMVYNSDDFVFEIDLDRSTGEVHVDSHSDVSS